MNAPRLLVSLILTVALASGSAQAQDAPRSATPTPATPQAAAPAPIGVIAAPTLEQAKASALDWLKSVKADAATLQKAEALWQPGESPLLDRLVATFVLGDAEAARLYAFLPHAPGTAIKEVPASLKDTTKPMYFRANLGLYFAKVAVDRKLHEEGYEVLRVLRPEQIVDPAAYYFYKAACENKLRLKSEGLASVHRLLNSVPNAPERYTVVAQLMEQEMQRWKDADLGDIGRRMDEIANRLDNARGGPKTQQKQKDLITLLDKTIEEVEKQRQQAQGGGGSAKNRSQKPADDSNIAGGETGKGEVDPKRFTRGPDQWGKMPEKEKLKALEAISRSLPPHMREAGEGYRNNLVKGTRGSSGN